MPQSDLRLEILGTSFTITADEEGPYLEKLLNDYYARLEEVQKSTGLRDPLKIAILAGYLLCDDLHKIKQERDDPEEEETFKRTLKLIARLDEVLENDAPAIYPLVNLVKHYEWGSPYWIPQLLNAENPGEDPWAELWMGVHPSSPSMVDISGKKISLAELIALDPPRYLGREGAEQFNARLPFLFKLLAAARPLSIQAHPSKAQALRGWQEENRRGIPPDSPERNYKDDNHKPEIICALSPFLAMCGFREPAEIKSLLVKYLANAPLSLQSGLAPLWSSLENTGDALRIFLKTLFSIPQNTREELTSYVLSLPIAGGGAPEPWDLVRRFALLYPGDPGILAPLYLNLLHLAPGEAIYLPAGVLHAYVDGFGVELMANSDNVLRGGLTPKHVDVDELIKVLDFRPFMPELLKPPVEAGCFSYPSPCKEFSLSVLHNTQGPFPIQSPAIVMVTRGELKVSVGNQVSIGNQVSGDCWELRQGDSAFIPPQTPLLLSGTYTLYAASLPL
jgi:mannose-6-phosphate isomerase